MKSPKKATGAPAARKQQQQQHDKSKKESKVDSAQKTQSPKAKPRETKPLKPVKPKYSNAAIPSTCPFYQPPSRVLTKAPAERKHLNLHTFEETPDYMHDNPYIRTGYRMHYTARMSIRSVCAMHNETFNIWTHLLGFFLFLFLVGFLFVHVLPRTDYEMQLAAMQYEEARAHRVATWSSIVWDGVREATLVFPEDVNGTHNGPNEVDMCGATHDMSPALSMMLKALSNNDSALLDKSKLALANEGKCGLHYPALSASAGWSSPEVLERRKFISRFIFTLFSFGCLLCMLCSCLYHTFIGHWSTKLYAWAHALDYFGITTLVVGSFIPFCFYCFYCEPLLQLLYIGMISILGIVGILGPMFQKWTSPEFTPIKLAFYVAMVGSGVFPTIHAAFLIPMTASRTHVLGLALMMMLYGVGVLIYATKFPECLFPGRFDNYLSSHQIWHCFVLAAALVHFYNCIGMFWNFKEMPLSC